MCVSIQKSHFSKYKTLFCIFFTIGRKDTDIIKDTAIKTESCTHPEKEETIFSTGNKMSIYYVSEKSAQK